MRFLLLVLFVSAVLTEEQIAKTADKKGENKKELKKSIEEQIKSKTGKRDSSGQTSSFGINNNDGPFKPMLNSPAPFVAAASDTQQVYYDKNQVTAGAVAGNAKIITNPQAANTYRQQYTQVAQQPNKNQLRVNAKSVVIQQQPQQQQQPLQPQQQNTQPSILYAAPQNPAYHYESIPTQSQAQQPQLQLPAAPLPTLPVQRAGGGQQKQIQYLIAIPITYLRQLQQQLIHQQQQEQPAQLQIFKGQQQPLAQQQVQAVPVYSVAGPLARDHQGSYRPFHRFALTAVNDASQQQSDQITAAPAPPGYNTQYLQIPTSVLLAAMQSPHVQQQLQQQQQQSLQRPNNLPQQVFAQQQQPQLQLQLQQPIQQQQHQQPLAQTQPSHLFYYQPQPQQQQQQQIQFKPAQSSDGLSPSPVYAYSANPVQQQQYQPPTQQYPAFQHLAEQQQVNDGKQILRVRGIRPTANLAPNYQQYDATVEAYESEEKAQIVQPNAPTHLHTTQQYTNAHNQQSFLAPAPIVRPQTTPPLQHQLAATQAPESYDHNAHYNPQYVQHYHQAQQPSRQPHRLHQIQTHLAEHINNLPYSQAIQDPTPLPFMRYHTPTAGGTSLHNLNIGAAHAIAPNYLSGGFQPSFTPLGTPSKVTSFANVLLQPSFGGHPASLPTSEIGAGTAAGVGSLPFLHSSGGVRYATHLYHPTTVLAGNKPHSAVTQSDPRVAKGRPTIVKYP